MKGNLLLKERVTSEMFDTAVRLLLNRKEMEITQDVILTGFLLNYFSMSNENPMRSLLLEDFHNSHEDIVSLFQTLWNESIENNSSAAKGIREKYPHIYKIGILGILISVTLCTLSELSHSLKVSWH